MHWIAFLISQIVPWPASDERINPPNVFQPYADAIATLVAGAASADDAKLLDLSLKLFDNDAARRSSIDSRAGGMMSAITLAATLVTGVGFTTFKDTSGLSTASFWAVFLTFVLALLYLTATILLLFRIQGSVVRSTPDPADLAVPAPADPSPYPRQVSVRLLRYTISNYRANNRVMNRLEMAQTCFRNALFALVAGGIVTALLMLSTAPAPGGMKLAQSLALQAGCADLPNLAADKAGVWHGTCTRFHRPVNVIVDPDGRVDFPP